MKKNIPFNTVKNFILIIIRAIKKEIYFEQLNLDLEIKNFLTQLSSTKDSDSRITQKKRELISFANLVMDSSEEEVLGQTEGSNRIIFEHFQDEVD